MFSSDAGPLQFMKAFVMTKINWWLLGPISIFLFLAWAYLPESIDDAYITLRYAKNLMHGYGPVFNIGEPVEGFSNPAWMFLLATVGWLGFSMPLAMKVLGIISGIGTIFLTKDLASKWFDSKAIGISAAFVVSTSSFMALWAADGLETSFYCFLITLLLYLTTSAKESGWQTGLVASIVVLTRPEGVMFAILAVLYLFIYKHYRAAAKCLFIWLLVFICYEVFRLRYYGEWVPNTAFLKIHTGKESIGAALDYVRSFNRDSGYFFLPLVFFGAILNIKNRNFLLAIFFVLAQMLFLGICGGDFMFGYRFLIPIFPALVLLMCGAANKLTGRRIAIAVSFIVFFGGWLCLAQYNSRPPIHIGFDNLTYRSSVHFEISDYLAKNTTAKDTVLLSEAGIIPFGIDARVDDYLGLISPYWAIHARDRAFLVKNLFAHNPKYVVLSFMQDMAGTIQPRLFQDAAIFQSPEFSKNYIPARRFDIDKTASLLNYIYYFYSPSAEVIYFEVYLKKR